MTDLTYAELRALLSKATPAGEWLLAEGNASSLVYALDENGFVNRFSARFDGGYVRQTARRRSSDAERTSENETAANAALAHAAVRALPALLATAEAAEAREAALRAENERLREALRPFAREADEWDGVTGVARVLYIDTDDEEPQVTLADFRAARAALSEQQS